MAVRAGSISFSIRFFVSSLLRAGFLLFNWPSRIANVRYVEKFFVSSNSVLIYCARKTGAASKITRNDIAQTFAINTSAVAQSVSGSMKERAAPFAILFRAMQDALARLDAAA